MSFLLLLNGEKLKSTRPFIPQVISNDNDKNNNTKNNRVTSCVVWQYLPTVTLLLVLFFDLQNGLIFV